MVQASLVMAPRAFALLQNKDPPKRSLDEAPSGYVSDFAWGGTGRPIQAFSRPRVSRTTDKTSRVLRHQ